MIKQIIVIRKDLNMRRGKEISQGAHAAMAFLSNRIRGKNKEGLIHLTEQQWQWIEGMFTKICVKVNSEQELLDIETKAKAAGIECHVITDNGLTEFNGVPTKTCLALGPDTSENIDPITKHLPLY